MNESIGARYDSALWSLRVQERFSVAGTKCSLHRYRENLVSLCTKCSLHHCREDLVPFALFHPYRYREELVQLALNVPHNKGEQISIT